MTLFFYFIFLRITIVPAPSTAPVQHAVLPPAAPIIHRQAPNVAPGTESDSRTTPAPSTNSGIKTDDKKDDSKKTSEDKSKDDKSKDDSKNTEHTVAEDSTSANKDPDRDKAGDYSVSMKNKDPKIKDANKQVKLRKQKSSSSLPWIIVIVFVVLGAITIGGFYLYKKSQEDY